MAGPTAASSAPAHHGPWYKHLDVQVLCAIAIGVFLGLISPSKPELTPAWIPDWMRITPGWAEAMKPFGDAFVKVIKMLIAPIIFCSVVHGIASMGDLKKVGRVGIKALVYFELVTTLALAVGLIISNVWQPGAGMNIDPNSLDIKSIASYAAKAKEQSVVRVPDAHHPQHGGRRVRRGRDPAGAVPRDPVRVRPAQLGSAATCCSASSTRPPHACSPWSASSCGPRRSGRSAPWHSPSASTAS